MRIDRHDISEESVASALADVPEQLDRDTKLAENGGPYGIKMLADMLLDYAAARTVEIDPLVETRETWLALTSAAELYRDYVLAQTVPAGGEVRAFVEYLGVGFGFRQQDDESLSTHEWLWAYQVALAVGAEGAMLDLSRLIRSLPEDDDLLGLRAFFGKQPAETYPDSPEGRMLRAIAQGDAAAFNAALGAALEQHRERAGRHPRDLIAWGPLAMTAFAHEAELPIEVESGYLPERLLTQAGPKKPSADGPVARPEFDADRAARWLESDSEISEEEVEHAFSPKVLVQFRFSAMAGPADHKMRALSFLSVLDPRAESSAYVDGLLLASESFASAFRLASVPRGTAIAVTLRGRTEELPASGPNGNASDWRYARAAALAWTSRREADAAILAAFDPDDLDVSLPDTNSYARACRAVLRGEDPRPHLRNALAKTSGDGHWECLRNPRARLLERIAEDDADGFNAVLADALGLYRDYYSAGENIDDPDGQLSFDALGLACLAHDRGVPVRVESDYLPRAVIDGLSPR
ncbi:immunity 49 family protein [Actinomadura madurae]|uniref:immunity 49 family protein n=3 Tax=Actinomadura madurae TaxID=1993 RepID=UPI0020263DFF|nr:immunity 49 family protein [Actinomadura madurae]MCP9967852.1 immunity 49 family protein [Actinomadura madurae]MCP9980306.1 immunity 49 family protein [Actinomadura madurae]URN07294.1 immunity 49 family protein [Actinomadura madurae]